MHWYKIAPKRISSDWWDSVVAPLKALESAASGSVVQLEQLQASSSNLENIRCTTERGISHCPIESANDPDRSTDKVSKIIKSMNLETSVDCHGSASRDSLEDMELATRALTEPLPTNQLVKLLLKPFLSLMACLSSCEVNFFKLIYLNLGIQESPPLCY